jgi:hypothetical protein
MGLFTFAKQLGHNDCASVLQQTLEEEKAADKLTTIADSRVRPRSGRDCRSCTRGFRRRTRRGLAGRAVPVTTGLLEGYLESSDSAMVRCCLSTGRYFIAKFFSAGSWPEVASFSNSATSFW